MPPIPELVAHKIAGELDIDVHDIGVCLACLSFVSFAIDARDAREIRLWTNRMTPDLWAEGLEQPARRTQPRREGNRRPARGSTVRARQG